LDVVRLLGVVVVGAVNIGLAIAVLVRNRKSVTNRAFAAGVFAIVAWLTLAFMSDQPRFGDVALQLNRLTFSAAMVMGAAFLYFVLVFPKPSGGLSWVAKAFFCVGIVLMVPTAASAWTIEGVRFAAYGTDVVGGPLLPAVAAWLVVGIGYIVATLVQRYRLVSGFEKAQLKFMLLGLTLFTATSIVLGLLLPMITGTYQLSGLNAFASLFLVGFTAYAMVRHRLMDIRLAVLRGAAYTVLVGALGGALVGVAVITRGGWSAGLGVDHDALFLVSCLIALFAFQPLRRALDRLTDSIFHRATYDPDAVLGRVGAGVASTLDLHEIATMLAQELGQNMRLVSATVAYYGSQGPTTACYGTEPGDDAVLQLLALAQGGPTVVSDDLEPDSHQARTLADAGVRVLVPMVAEDEELGAILLGAKRSGSMYTAEDLRFLDILRSEASIAMKNAHLFDERNQRVRELTALNDLAYSLSGSIELDVLLDAALGQVVAVTRADSGSIMLLGEDDETLHVAAGYGMSQLVIETTRVEMGDGVAGWVAATKAPLILVDDTDPRFRGELQREEIVSAISAPIVSRDAVIGVLNVNRVACPELFTRENLHVVTSFAGQLAIAIENAQLYENLEDTFLGTISALAATVDAKDPYTYGHSQEVTTFAVAIAECMDLSEQAVHDIRVAATLHDIGKLAVDGAILQKPGRLTPEERELMNRHPATAADILSSLEFLKDAVPLILFHHERFGGGGYPSGVSGETIPLGARIIAVADSFNAMVSDRPYRAALTVDAAVQELKDCSGTQFDPEVVDAFLDVLASDGTVAGPSHLAAVRAEHAAVAPFRGVRVG
jgi:HD-GYP domain-containing protein (c-di-GMP phosphodiesterase class II)